jgi:hypothetical protein
LAQADFKKQKWKYAKRHMDDYYIRIGLYKKKMGKRGIKGRKTLMDR